MALSTGWRQAGVIMVITVASSSEPQPSSPERGGPLSGGRLSLELPALHGQGRDTGPCGHPGDPRLAPLGWGARALFESMGNYPPLAPPTSRARYPHERAPVGERLPLSSDAIKAGTSHGKSNALLA